MEDKREQPESLIKIYARTVERMVGLAVLAVIGFVAWRIVDVNWFQYVMWLSSEDRFTWASVFYLGILMVLVVAVGRAIYYAGAVRGARSVGRG